MTVQDKFYILVDGYALDVNLEKTGQDDQVAFYNSEAEINTALANNGVSGKQYTTRQFKEVVE